MPAVVTNPPLPCLPLSGSLLLLFSPPDPTHLPHMGLGSRKLFTSVFSISFHFFQAAFFNFKSSNDGEQTFKAHLLLLSSTTSSSTHATRGRFCFSHLPSCQQQPQVRRGPRPGCDRVCCLGPQSPSPQRRQQSGGKTPTGNKTTDVKICDLVVFSCCWHISTQSTTVSTS